MAKTGGTVTSLFKVNMVVAMTSLFKVNGDVVAVVAAVTLFSLLPCYSR